MSAASLATRVKAAREGAQLTMRGIEGVDHSQLSRIEAGKVTDPGIATMTAIAKATGKTVDELMGAPASAVRMIALADIEADPENPRTVDVADSVDADFVQSIRDHGLLQAITVRRVRAEHSGKSAQWRIAFGGRRYAALVLIHGPRSKVLVPALVKDAEGIDLLLKQLVENVARADMNPADLAVAVTKLVDGKMDTAAIATALKMGRRWVQEQASIGHHLTVYGLELLRKGSLSISQAVALAAERDFTKQDSLSARASLEALSEDEIRAIIADAREKAAAEADARQTSLADQFEKNDGQAVYPTANEDGAFTGKPDVRRRWNNKRGHFEITLFQFGDHKWTAGFNTKWRPTTSRADEGVSKGAASRKRYVQQTAALSFLDCARDHYTVMLDRAKNHPEDVPAMRELHQWIDDHLAYLGATARVQADWKTNNPAPEKPKPKPPAKAKAVPKAKPIDITEPPTWAQPMVGALFMFHTGRDAFLCKGWRQMARTFSEHLDADQEELRHLYDRSSWANDTEGKPFDFGGAVVRLRDAPA